MRRILSTRGAGTIVYPEARKQNKTKQNLSTYLTAHGRINLKHIINLNVRVQAIKLLEKNVEYLSDFGLGKHFKNMAQKV